MNLGACRRLASTPETGTWYRAVRLPYITTPINTAHTRSTLSRFSPGPYATPPFDILYLTETPQVAQFEIGALAGDPLAVGGMLYACGSFGVIDVKVVLQRVADLTLVDQQEHIETTAQELTGDWQGYRQRALPAASIHGPVGSAPTQDLGEALFAVLGLEGFRTVSAKLPYHRNLVIFPQKMFKGSRLEFHDPSASLFQVIEGKVPKTARRGWHR